MRLEPIYERVYRANLVFYCDCTTTHLHDDARLEAEGRGESMKTLAVLGDVQARQELST